MAHSILDVNVVVVDYLQVIIINRPIDLSFIVADSQTTYSVEINIAQMKIAQSEKEHLVLSVTGQIEMLYIDVRCVTGKGGRAVRSTAAGHVDGAAYVEYRIAVDANLS